LASGINRLIGAMAVTVTAVLAMVVVGAVPASADAISGDPWEWELQAQHSGKCLAVAGGSLDNGAPLVQFDCTRQFNEWFYAKTVPATGNYQIFVITYTHSSSLKCLAVDGWSDANGARVVQWDCDTTGKNYSQQWNYVGSADSGVRLFNAWSGLYLSVAGGSTANNAPVVQWAYTGLGNQTWTYTNCPC
jgi:Ricin-type beta-trefoil lectin domain